MNVHLNPVSLTDAVAVADEEKKKALVNCDGKMGFRDLVFHDELKW